MRDVVVRLTEREIEALATNRRFLGRQGEETSARHKLRAALDPPPVEEETEYRVIEDIEIDDKGREWVVNGSPPLVELEGAMRLLAHRKERGAFRGRIQSRATTQLPDGSELIGPWTDLEGEGGDRG